MTTIEIPFKGLKFKLDIGLDFVILSLVKNPFYYNYNILAEIYSKNKIVYHPIHNFYGVLTQKEANKLYDLCVKYIKLLVFA